MAKKRILIIGGTGFVGKAICKELENHRIFTFGKSSKNNFQGSITSLDDLKKSMKNIDIVINLVGLSPLKKPKIPYKTIHVDAVKNIINSCKECKVKHLIHMSALGANKNSDIEYLRTKGLGEELVSKSGLKITIFCPSIIYDKENELNKILSKTKFTLFFPNIKAKLQPIHRKDVAMLFKLAINNKIKEKKLDIAGPETLTMFQLAKKIYNQNNFPCFPLPLSIIRSFMILASWLNLFGITKDQIKSLYLDNITKNNLAGKYIKLRSAI
jgi:uncharacterized protein YbjT (DUF2867 family)